MVELLEQSGITALSHFSCLVLLLATFVVILSVHRVEEQCVVCVCERVGELRRCRGER